MGSDERRAEHDQRRQDKFARKYGAVTPELPNVPNPPNSPRFNVDIEKKDDDDDKLPLDQRLDTRIEPGMSENEIDERIRRRISLRVKQRHEFYTHLVSYVAVNVMLWAIWLISGSGFPWPMFVTLGWGIGIFAHAGQVYQNSVSVSARRERTVQHEIELEKSRLGLSGYDYEKPKRVYRDSLESVPDLSASSARMRPSQQVRLSDDGELIPAEDNDSDNVLNRPSQSTRARNDREA